MSDEYDALLEDAGNDYDALLEEPPPDQGPPLGHTAPAPAPQIAGTDAMVLGEGQGMFGLGDEITSGARALRDTALTPERKWSDLLNLYRAYKSNMGRDIKAAQTQHPLAYMAGNLPMAVASAVGSAGAIPGALTQAAPWGANTVINIGQSIAQRWGQDELTPGNVLKDVAAGEIMAAPMRIAQHGIRRTIGEVAQLPQQGIDEVSDRLGGTSVGRALGANADDLTGNTSKRVKDLQTAQQSYLTQAGKQQAAADAALSGSDLPSRLAKSASDGRATLGPRGFTADPAEFGDDIYRISKGATQEAADRFAPGKGVYDYPVLTMQAQIKEALASGDMAKANELSAQIADVSKMANRTRTDEIGYTMDTARDTLARFQQAKEAEAQARTGAMDAADELGRIKTGRGALQNLAGIVGGGAAGHSVGGPIGAMLGIAGGKQLGKGAFQTIDLAGEIGQKLAAATPTLERLASGGGKLGDAARWVLSGEGPAFVSRFFTLAQLPEFQAELGNDASPQAQ